MPNITKGIDGKEIIVLLNHLLHFPYAAKYIPGPSGCSLPYDQMLDNFAISFAMGPVFEVPSHPGGDLHQVALIGYAEKWLDEEGDSFETNKLVKLMDPGYFYNTTNISNKFTVMKLRMTNSVILHIDHK